MDPFYAFLIFACVAFLDILLSQTWVGFYYRFGIPVYYKRIPRARPLDLPALEAAFKSSQLNPSIRFKPLDAHLIAFREMLFENRSGLRYLPIMHSLLLVSPADTMVSIVGMLNWYVLAALAYLVYRSIEEPSYVPVGILVVVVLLLSYFGQVSISQRLAKSVAE